MLQASSWRIGSRLRGGGGQEDGVDDDRTIRRSRVALEWGGGGKKRTAGLPPRRTRGEVFRVDLRYRLFGLCFK